MAATDSVPTALVTGASRGIGRAIAEQLAARGLRIAVHFRENRSAAEDVLAGLPGPGHRLFQADVSEPGACAELFSAVVEAFGRCDLLVNNAGVYEKHDLTKDTFAEWQQLWRRTLAANLEGPAHLSFLAARHMRVAGGGRIVNISSRGAFRGEPDAPAYGAAKAGLNAFGQSLAKALAPEAIYVFSVAPGWVDTDMAAPHLNGPRAAEILGQQPLGRVTSTEEVARTVVFCALDAPAAMTGAIIDVNGASYLRT